MANIRGDASAFLVSASCGLMPHISDLSKWQGFRTKRFEIMPFALVVPYNTYYSMLWPVMLSDEPFIDMLVSGTTLNHFIRFHIPEP